MSELKDLLAGLTPEIEEQLKPALSGLFGGIVKGYLPQVWGFRTERGSAALAIDDSGNVSAVEGVPPTADVIIVWGHDQLLTALKTRSKEAVPAGHPPQVDFRSPKGKTAFTFLRGRLGI